MLSFGATACLSKETQGRDVVNAIHLASRGMHVLPRSAAPAAASDLGVKGSDLLTPREADVLELLQDGATNAQIAQALSIGLETVRTHARNIYRKLGISSRRDLARLGRGPRRSLVERSRAPSASRLDAGRAAAEQAAHVQQLGHLHRVGGRALAQVVAHHPEVQAALVRGVAADAAHQHVVLARGVDGQRVQAVGRVVDHPHAGRGRQQLAALLGRERVAGLHVHRLGVARVHGHAHAGGRDAQVVVAEDLARLGHHLALLGGVVVAVLEGLHLRAAR